MRRLLYPLFWGLLLTSGEPAAQNPRVPAVPTATLRKAELLLLPGGVDSNSPVVWDRVDGRTELHVLTSIGGRTSRARGGYLTMLTAPEPVSIAPWPGGGVWIEAIVKDRDAWYGYYHNENAASACSRPNLTYPRIGAVRSTDAGASWTDLGIILDAPPETFACSTANRYFVGGVGDMSVMLDRAHQDVYIYFSQYGRDARRQGVSVARLAWADRDEPVGKLTVWSRGVWLPGTRIDDEEQGERWVYPRPTALVMPANPWHDSDRQVDAFWGPSIHWNTHLRQYVMLLNRAKDESFTQEGIYISFNPRISEPDGWSAPQKILDDGRWYPQVVGLELGRGTDALAAQVARFFMGGRSEYVIEFSRAATLP